MAGAVKITQRVGVVKAELGLPAAASRPGRPVRSPGYLARDADLDLEFAEKLPNFIVSEVVRHHLQIADAHGDAGTD